MNYIDIQNEVIKKYRIDICDGTRCEDGDWSRTHAHLKQRRVCKWKQASSITSTLTLFHEIGHIENNNSKMRRCEQEYHATVWAIEKLREYGILDKVPDSKKTLYQRYIYQELDRGLRRGGSGYPTKDALTLDWRADTKKSKKTKIKRKFYEVRSFNDNHGLSIRNDESAEIALEEINSAYRYAKTRGYDNRGDKWIIVCNQLTREFDENGAFIKEECTRSVVARAEYSDSEDAFIIIQK